MKDLREGLRAYLLADSAISTLIADRIFAGRLKQGEQRTSCVYQLISESGDYSMQAPTGLSGSRFQVDAWAKDPDAAAELADKIRARIDGFKGVMGSGAAAVNVQGVFIDDTREDHDSEAGLFRKGRDYRIWHEIL